MGGELWPRGVSYGLEEEGRPDEPAHHPVSFSYNTPCGASEGIGLS